MINHPPVTISGRSDDICSQVLLNTNLECYRHTTVLKLNSVTIYKYSWRLRLGYGLDGTGFEFRQWQNYFFFLKLSDRSWGSPNLLFIGWRGSLQEAKRPGREVNHWLYPVSSLRVIGIYLLHPGYPLTAWTVEILPWLFTSISKYQISIQHFERSVCVYWN